MKQLCRKLVFKDLWHWFVVKVDTYSYDLWEMASVESVASCAVGEKNKRKQLQLNHVLYFRQKMFRVGSQASKLLATLPK